MAVYVNEDTQVRIIDLEFFIYLGDDREQRHFAVSAQLVMDQSSSSRIQEL